MNLFQALTVPIFSPGVKASVVTCDLCERSLPLKNPAARKVGIHMRGHWYCSASCFTKAAELELSSLMSSRYYRQDPKPRMPLALSLVSRGILTEENYRRAARLRKETGREIGELLIEYGVITEEQLTAARAAQWGCPVFDVPDFPSPEVVHIPQALIDTHDAVPLHYVQGTKTLLVGFAEAIEYGFLYAVETISSCKTQACFVTPSDYYKRMQQRQLIRESGGVAPPMELRVDHARSVSDIARALCKTSVEFEADDVVLAQCKDYVWARLKCTGKEIDLLFSA